MDYVCVFAEPVGMAPLSAVLVCCRLKDDWQKGRFNLIGGKLDPSECCIAAAIRELREETGLSPVADLNDDGSVAQVMGRIHGDWGQVQFVRVRVDFAPLAPPAAENACQIPVWAPWNALANNPLLLPNLHVIIPLMAQGVHGWEIGEQGLTDSQAYMMNVALSSDVVEVK